MKTQTIALIGLNRQTVSIGLALKQSSFTATIFGYDDDRALSQIAKDDLKAIDKTEWNLGNLVSRADILLLAAPADQHEPLLATIGQAMQAHAVLLDLSTQKQLGQTWAAEHLARGHYVGVAPILSAAMMEDGRSDIRHATADAFRQSVWCVMPSAESEPDAVETAVQFGRLLGATPYFLEAAEFDKLIQGVTLLPGLVAAGLFAALHKAEGWADLQRVAGQPFALLTQPVALAAETAVLANQHKSATLRWLDAFITEMQQLRQLVDETDVDILRAVLNDQQVARESWLRLRQKNDWADEARLPDIPTRSFMEQMLGGLAPKREKNDDE